MTTRETRYAHHQHDDDFDAAHEADMRALRGELLAADIDLDEDTCDRCRETLRKCECCACRTCIRGGHEPCLVENMSFDDEDDRDAYDHGDDEPEDRMSALDERRLQHEEQR